MDTRKTLQAVENKNLHNIHNIIILNNICTLTTVNIYYLWACKTALFYSNYWRNYNLWSSFQYCRNYPTYCIISWVSLHLSFIILKHIYSCLRTLYYNFDLTTWLSHLGYSSFDYYGISCLSHRKANAFVLTDAFNSLLRHCVLWLNVSCIVYQFPHFAPR